MAAASCAVLPFFVVCNPSWDGWAHYALFLRGDSQAIMDHMIANGRPLGGWAIVQPMALFGALHGPKLVMAACIIGSAAALFLALRTARLATPAEAALVATLTVCVPALQTITAAAMPQFFIGQFALFAGLWAFLASDHVVGWARRTLYGAAVLLAVAAVLFGEAPLALLPVYPALLVAGRGAGPGMLNVLRRWPELLRHSSPVAAGALALGLQFAWYPAYGAHTGAHDFATDSRALAALGFQYAHAVGICVLPIGAVVALLAPRRIARVSWDALLFGFAVLLLGLLPYWIAGRTPDPWGWEVRMLLFSGFGIGLMALALLRPSWPDPARFGVVAVLVMAVAVLNVAWRAPLWASRQATEDAVMAVVAAQPTLRGPALMAVVDPGWVIGAPYRHYEWTAMAQLATGRSDVLALSAGEVAELPRWLGYFRKELRMLRGDPVAAGCTVRLTLHPRPPGFVASAMRGLWLRWTDSAAYQRWLLENVPIDVAANCSSVAAKMGG